MIAATTPLWADLMTGPELAVWWIDNHDDAPIELLAAVEPALEQHGYRTRSRIDETILLKRPVPQVH